LPPRLPRSRSAAPSGKELAGTRQPCHITSRPGGRARGHGVGEGDGLALEALAGAELPLDRELDEDEPTLGAALLDEPPLPPLPPVPALELEPDDAELELDALALAELEALALALGVALAEADALGAPVVGAGWVGGVLVCLGTAL
jgi:hypothetical protein